MNLSAMIAAMEAEGCDPRTILAVVRRIEAQRETFSASNVERKLAKARARVRAYRERHADKPTPRDVPPDLRKDVFARDGHRCAYCGRTDGPMHVDHIVPWTRGGDTALNNLTVACAPCNMSKGRKTLAEWRAQQ